MKQKTIGIVVVLSILALGSVAAALTNEKKGEESSMLNKAEYDKLPRLLFMAVLEGLYTDGVQNDVVDMVLRESEDNPAVPTGFSMHFVYGCPICMPAYDAFRTYRMREVLLSIGKKKIVNKRGKDTFGQGLSKEMRERLLSDVVGTRLSAMGELMQRWVDRRLETMRLTEEERNAWQRLLAVGRKQGMSQLGTRNGKPSTYKMKTCAFCDGAVTAADRAIQKILQPKGKKN